VIPVLLAAGLGVIAGGGLAVGATGLTGALAGLLGLLVVAPLIADPPPLLLSLAVRIVGALLTVELLWIATHRAPDLRRPLPLGLPAVLLAGLGGAIVGLALPSGGRSSDAGTGAAAVLPVLGTLIGDIDLAAITRAAAIGLGIVGLAAVFGRGPLCTIAIGAAVLLTGAELLVVGSLGPLTPLEHLLIAITQVSIAGAALAIASSGPVGPPLAGRATSADGASPMGDDDTPLKGRRRIPVWPGVRAASPWARRRNPPGTP
jgi:hypothetical protein